MTDARQHLPVTPSFPVFSTPLLGVHTVDPNNEWIILPHYNLIIINNMYVFVYIIYVTYDDIFIYFFRNHRFDLFLPPSHFHSIFIVQENKPIMKI